MKVFNHAAELVDLDQYPIEDLGSDVGRAFAERCRQQYLETGLCMLPNFIVPDALKVLAEQANGVSDEAFFCNNTHNAYLTEDDSTLPEEAIERRQEKTFVGSVAYDRIGKESQLFKLYHWDPLKNFIGYVLGKDQFFRFADPLGACSINVFVEGGEHGWHFDESEFTVTLMLQPPDSGGVFEYVPQIRGREDEKDLVAGILNGNRNDVIELPFSAGTLLIFGGRQTIHRVTRVAGSRPRLVPVLCYAETPDLTNSESVRKLFWGRTGNESEVQR
ncbi:MAG: HalD/BesD family halogenase [bacterium]